MKAMERETFKKKNCRRHVKTQLNNCGSRSRNRRDTLLTFPECRGREGNANDSLRRLMERLARLSPVLAQGLPTPGKQGVRGPNYISRWVRASYGELSFSLSLPGGMRMGERQIFFLHVTSDDWSSPFLGTEHGRRVDSLFRRLNHRRKLRMRAETVAAELVSCCYYLLHICKRTFTSCNFCLAHFVWIIVLNAVFNRTKVSPAYIITKSKPLPNLVQSSSIFVYKLY